jgi:hypothetical protein
MAWYTGADLFRGATSFGGTGYTTVGTLLTLGGRFGRRGDLMKEGDKLGGRSYLSASRHCIWPWGGRTARWKDQLLLDDDLPPQWSG